MNQKFKNLSRRRHMGEGVGKSIKEEKQENSEKWHSSTIPPPLMEDNGILQGYSDRTKAE